MIECSFKVVLVTGGGTGLGKGMSMKFSSLGAKVHEHESSEEKIIATPIKCVQWQLLPFT